MRTFFLALSAAMTLGLTVGCGQHEDRQGGDDSYDGSDGSSSSEDSYSNDVFVECNGDVLVDEHFDSYDECEDFCDGNYWDCFGMDLECYC